MSRSFRLFVALGLGDVVSARRWAAASEAVDSTSIAYSEQLANYCTKRNFPTLALSANRRADILIDGMVTLENRPKPLGGAAGLGFHVSQAAYAIDLCWRAVRFDADAAVIHSGASHYFCPWLFRVFGIRLVANQHSTLWQLRGHRHTRVLGRVLLTLDILFFFLWYIMARPRSAVESGRAGAAGSVVIWFPLVCAGSSIIWERQTALLLIYTAQLLRTTFRQRGDWRNRAQRVLFELLGRFAKAVGQLRFAGHCLLGWRSQNINTNDRHESTYLQV